MNKYLLLIILNLPFILYALVRTIIYFKEGLYGKAQLVIRLVFWLGALTLILFAKPIYDWLIREELSNSTPLSLMDVLLATACFLSFTMIIRLYARLEKAERKITDFNQALAIHGARKSSRK